MIDLFQGKHSAAIGGSASFPSKPLRLGTVNSLPTSTKRDSVGAKCIRAEKSVVEHTGKWIDTCSEVRVLQNIGFTPFLYI